MEIDLNQISKRYGWQWVFHDVSFSLHSNNIYAIQGPNGSGKSTLMRIISSMESPTSGDRKYKLDGKDVEEGDVASYLSFCAPYMEVPDFLSVSELVAFHGEFKSLLYPHKQMMDSMGMSDKADKKFHQLSSGQKHKIKLALTVLNNDPLLLLDEPGTNLDEANYAWLAEQIGKVKDQKLICIATNDARDLELCNDFIDLKNWTSN